MSHRPLHAAFPQALYRATPASTRQDKPQGRPSNFCLSRLRGRSRRSPHAGWASILCACLTACAGDGGRDAFRDRQANLLKRDERPLRDQTEEVFRPSPLRSRTSGGANPGAAATNPGPARSDASFSITLASFGGPDRDALAQEALTIMQSRDGMTDAAIERREKVTVIVTGAFSDPNAPEAQAELARVRGLTVNGTQPFALAMLAPTGAAALAGNTPEFDLRHAKETFGRTKAKYTLQIGVYGKAGTGATTPEELKEFRAAAEKAVADLRRDGELAFYYHGPQRSTVTVGVFDDSDYDPRAPRMESERLRETRRRFPNNLLNGMGIRQSLPSARDPEERVSAMQRSLLVPIPDPS